MQLHYFTILLVTSIGVLIHFLGSYSNFMTESTVKDNEYLKYYGQFASDRAYVAKHAIWFAVITGMGAIFGALALIMKKPNNP